MVGDRRRLLWGPRGSTQTLEATGLSSRVQDAYRQLDAGTVTELDALFDDIADQMVDELYAVFLYAGAPQ